MHFHPTDIADIFKTALIQNGFAGDFHIDHATRLVNATDNSIYEVLPLAVAQPRDVQDIQLLLNVANQKQFSHLYFGPRGGGTGTNGQSLTDGIVIDFSRFMTRILEFNPKEQTITVEPGVILSDLNRTLQPHGLFFAPHVSTADRATIGGMIATDAAGKGSLIYGKTADHLLGLHFILVDGQEINTILNNTTLVINKLAQKISTLLMPVQDEIAARFPPIKRPLSGYNIRQCYQNNHFDFNYLIAGSEGTLGIIAAAKLKLLPIPKHKILLVVHYASFLEALEDAQFLIQFQPLAIEVIDEKIQKSAQTLPNWPTIEKWLNLRNKNTISNFVEFVADSEDVLKNKINLVTAALIAKSAHFVMISDHHKINQLWTIRSLAVGLASKMSGRAKPVAFVEDAIVPPQYLAAFVAELQQELDKRQLNYAMYGHVDVGCIHVRPALNLQQENDRQKIRPITEMVIQLVTKHQGILWGEHGKGFRGEFVPVVFGPILYPILCEIKKFFDPHNRFNPGKLTSSNTIPLTKIESVPMRGQFDQIIETSAQKKFSGALLCNGNAACFNQEPSNVMCPSYKVTKNRIHSPKGRAMLIKEWLREKAKNKGQESQAAENAFNALSGCLGCKGCAGKCPTQVSIPDLRTAFLEEYHRRYKKRNLRDLALGYIESILPLAASIPRTWNFIQQKKIMPSLGLVNIPLFKKPYSLRHLLKKLNVVIYSHPKNIKNLPANSVVIFADVFTGLLNKAVLIATIQTLQKIGYNVAIIYPRVSGKAFIVGGLITQFKKNSRQLAKLLNPLFSAAIPVVALENTITLMLRDEMNKFSMPLKGEVLTLAELLMLSQHKLNSFLSVNIAQYYLLPHCTEQAILPSEAQRWQNVFASFGATLEIKNVGCCGMAGAYGHLKEQQENSADLFKMHWVPELSNTVILATGFSCRAQVEIQLGKKILHPIEVIRGKDNEK